MQNRIFQNTCNQLRKEIDRRIGIMDENGAGRLMIRLQVYVQESKPKLRMAIHIKRLKLITKMNILFFVRVRTSLQDVTVQFSELISLRLSSIMMKSMIKTAS